MLDKIKKNRFRIAIFGSARVGQDDKTYKNVFKLAEKIGEKGYDVITGGGPGLMQAANAGHQKGRKEGEAQSLGLTIKLPWESKANKYLDIKEHFDRFSERLDTFMMLSNVVVVMPGGIGTCLEFFYSWQLIQVKHVCSIPIVLVGDMWNNLIKWARKDMLKKGFISVGDFANVHTAKNNKAA
ncbi:hypothetical protein GF369_03275, partial [Candidatus Peregrinibacteria bacterium]|nr:hypothetical protein [Candidatus Peregrinibacteria bacterium]